MALEGGDSPEGSQLRQRRLLPTSQPQESHYDGDLQQQQQHHHHNHHRRHHSHQPQTDTHNQQHHHHHHRSHRHHHSRHAHKSKSKSKSKPRTKPKKEDSDHSGTSSENSSDEKDEIAVVEANSSNNTANNSSSKDSPVRKKQTPRRVNAKSMINFPKPRPKTPDLDLTTIKVAEPPGATRVKKIPRFDPAAYFQPTAAMRPTDPNLYPSTSAFYSSFSVSQESLSGGLNPNNPSPCTGDSRDSANPGSADADADADANANAHDAVSFSSEVSSVAIVAETHSPRQGMALLRHKASAVSSVTSTNPSPPLDEEADASATRAKARLTAARKRPSASPSEENSVSNAGRRDGNEGDDERDDDGYEEYTARDDENERYFGKSPAMTDLSTPTPAPIYYGGGRGPSPNSGISIRKRPVSGSCDSAIIFTPRDENDNVFEDDNNNNNNGNKDGAAAASAAKGKASGDKNSDAEDAQDGEGHGEGKKKKGKKGGGSGKRGVGKALRGWLQRAGKALRPQFKAVIVIVLLLGIVLPVVVSILLSIQRVKEMLGDYMPNFYGISSADYMSLIRSSLEVAEDIAQVEAYAYGDEMYGEGSTQESAEASLFGYGLTALKYSELHSTIYLFASIGSIYYGMSDVVNGSLVYRLSHYSVIRGNTYHFLLDDVVISLNHLVPIRVVDGNDIVGPRVDPPPEVATWASFVHSEYPQYVFFKTVYSSTRRYLGMVTSSYMFQRLRDVMASIPISSDMTFIVDTYDEMVLASTLPGLASDRPEPLARAQSEVALDAAAKIKARYGSWDALGNRSEAFWTSDDRDEIISVGMLVKPGLRWAVITVYRDGITALDAPETAFVAIIVCIAVALSIICSFEIVNPIKVLSWKMKEISKLNFQALSGSSDAETTWKWEAKKDGTAGAATTAAAAGTETGSDTDRSERRQRRMRRLKRMRRRRGTKYLRQSDLYDDDGGDDYDDDDDDDDLDYQDEGNTYTSKETYAVGNVYYYHSSSSSDNSDSSSSPSTSSNDSSDGYGDGASTSSADAGNMSTATESSNNNSSSSDTSSSSDSSSDSDGENTANNNANSIGGKGASNASGVDSLKMSSTGGGGGLGGSASNAPGGSDSGSGSTSGSGSAGNELVGRGLLGEGWRGRGRSVYLSEGFRNSERYSSINELREMQESFEKLRRVTQALTRYIPKQVVLHEILGCEGRELQIEMNSARLAILFVDIQNFTRLSEDLPPTKLLTFLSTWFREFCRVIEAHRGTVDKFIGDCIMALFCAPVPRADGEALACAAALGFRNASMRVNRYLRHKKMSQVQYRVGIHTGSVLLGNIGYAGHINYTVCGPNVSVAETMEKLGKRYRLTPLITGEVAKQVDEKFVCVMIGIAEVSKTRLVRVNYLAGKRSRCPECDKRAEKEFAEIFEHVAAESYEKALGSIRVMCENAQMAHYRTALGILDRDIRMGTLQAEMFRLSEPHTESDETSGNTGMDSSQYLVSGSEKISASSSMNK